MDRVPSPADRARLRALKARLDRPITLVGLMGAGKSTVGRRLATLLECNFVDADDAIEDAARLSIAEIFSEFGEDYFRDGERRVIARLIEEGHGVIATGGGAFVNDETRALVLEKAVAVWIDCDIATLVERAPHYAQAQIRVQGQQGPHTRTAWTIIEELEKWLS